MPSSGWTRTCVARRDPLRDLISQTRPLGASSKIIIIIIIIVIIITITVTAILLTVCLPMHMPEVTIIPCVLALDGHRMRLVLYSGCRHLN